MNIVIASDHGGFELKQALIEHFDNLLDLGCYTSDSCDYPDVAKKMAQVINNKEADLGILICGTGIGISIAINRYKNIRAAILYDDFTAQTAKEHNNANVIVFGGRTMSTQDVINRVDIFLNAQYEGGRHQGRIDKIEDTK